MGRLPTDPARADDRKMILSHPTRLSIASLCGSRPRTITEISEELGVLDGAIRHTVKQMRGWTVLELDTAASGPRRAVYSLNPEWQDDLIRARAAQRPFQLVHGQRLVLLAATSPDLPSTAGGVAWIAEFERQKKSLVALLDSDAEGLFQPSTGSGDAAPPELLEVSALRAFSK